MGIRSHISRFFRQNKSEIPNPSIIVEKRFIQAGTSFSGKTALVIGGTSGIGKAIAERLLVEQCKVIIAGRREFEDSRFSVVKWDVSQIENIHVKVNELITKYGRIDMVVNSQGICPEFDFKQDFFSIDLNDYDKVFTTNLESVFFICQAFCKYFEENNISGHILNIASTEGLKGSMVPYGISKSGVVSLTKGLGKAMIRKNIVINGIAPGATATQMMRMNENNSIRLDYLPSKRATIPDEIAELAFFLLSDSGSQMCGQVVCIDGGESLH